MGKKASYTADFKLKVIAYAEQHGKRTAARKYDVDAKCVRRWCAQKEDLKKAPKSKCAFRGKKCKYPQVENELYEYVINIRKSGYAVTTEMLQVEANKIARKMGISFQEFRASYGWLRRFMNRRELSIRRRTTICQKLPEQYEDKLIAFQKHVINLRKQNRYLLSQIGNADQTPVWFDMPENTTVNVRGERSVQVKTTGSEKQRCTVMLAITADGRKLPPYVVFKRKTMPKDKFPTGIIVRVQEKGWMTDDLVVDWINTVWARRPGGLLRQKSMLVLDSFRGHLTEKVKSKIREEKSDLVVIPGGMTKMLQPLDVVVNRPFKIHFTRHYNEWMRTADHRITPTGRVARASLPEVCRWIIQSWAAISADLVSKSFKVTSISNALDGTEDDLVCHRSDAENEDSSEDETDSDSD